MILLIFIVYKIATRKIKDMTTGEESKMIKGTNIYFPILEKGYGIFISMVF